MIDNSKLGPAAGASNDEIDLGRLLGTLLDHRWLIIGITTFFAVIGIVYSLFATPVYQSDALIQVEQSSGNSILNNLSEMLPTAQPGSAAEIELIKSRMVLGKTVADLNLNTVVEQKYFPIFGRGWNRLMGNEPGKIALSRLSIPYSWNEKDLELEVIDKNSFALSVDGEGLLKGKTGELVNQKGVTMLVSEIDAAPGTVFKVTKRSDLMAINALLAALTVEDKAKDTGVLALTLQGEDPELVGKTLDSISKNYLLQNVERKSEEAAKSLDFLKEQLPQVRTSLDIAEDKLNKFRQDNDSVDLSICRSKPSLCWTAWFLSKHN